MPKNFGSVIALILTANVINALLTKSTHFSLISPNGQAPETRALSTLQQSQVDVSDLGLTIEDLNSPLPPELLWDIAKSGHESTSRIHGQQNNGCAWTENAEQIEVVLAIPELRGQPSGCLAVELTESTVTVTAFGFAVWSAILRGKCIPIPISIVIEDGKDLVPEIKFTVEKADKESQWAGFIAQIGEDSVI
eukprot:CAMPEP_0113936142 /NCGR_PEP_ID=MMETSP1339-20121228/3115_1 /TAXON_ID=94617 /ORGANISM="Fibrocapsa japonica" /LENGTH=192 /DNA_ID=CAMNT_0000938501 /DNA_START=94 /DNA_END=672 /DNA_ORIENTATION=- /assembly_acc=CAM_ASM_000762